MERTNRGGEQVVAADAFDRLVSVFDGATEYHMGKAHLAKRGASQWAPMETCYFVYRTKEQVRSAVCLLEGLADELASPTVDSWASVQILRATV
jgi:hypothetical protein